jgi:putative methyltransferase
MSLYYDAVGVLTAPASTGGSFKSRLYNSRTLKASPAQVYALVVEAAKWDILLKEVIDNAGILKLEPKVSTPHLYHFFHSLFPDCVLDQRSAERVLLTDQEYLN